MKKKILCLSLILLFLLLLISSTVSSSDIDLKKSNNESISKPIFIMGTIISPVIENNTLNAKALQVVYFQSGLFVDNIGIIIGLKPVLIEKTTFFYMSNPGPFGIIHYIMGFCSDVQIID